MALKEGVVLNWRRARTEGRAAGAVENMVRVVAGRRRKEAKSLEAIVAGVVRVVDGLAQLVWTRES